MSVVRLVDVVHVRDYPVAWSNSEVARDAARSLQVSATTLFGGVSDSDDRSQLPFWCAHFRAWAAALAAAKRRSRPSRRQYVAFHVSGVRIHTSELEAALPQLLSSSPSSRSSISATRSAHAGPPRETSRRNPRLVVLATSDSDTLAYVCSTSHLRRMCRADSLAHFLTRIPAADSPLSTHRRHHHHDRDADKRGDVGVRSEDEDGKKEEEEEKESRGKTSEVGSEGPAASAAGKHRRPRDTGVGVRVDERGTPTGLLEGRQTQKRWNLVSDRTVYLSRFVSLNGQPLEDGSGVSSPCPSSAFGSVSVSASASVSPPGPAPDTGARASPLSLPPLGMDPAISARHILVALAGAIQPMFRKTASADRRRTARLRDHICRGLDASLDRLLAQRAGGGTSSPGPGAERPETPSGCVLGHRICAYLATWARATLHDSAWTTHFVELASAHAAHARRASASATPESKGDVLAEAGVLAAVAASRDGRWGGCVLTLHCQARSVLDDKGDWKTAARLLRTAAAYGRVGASASPFAGVSGTWRTSCFWSTTRRYAAPWPLA